MKPKKPKKVLTVRLDPEFVEQMRKSAKHFEVSLSKWIRMQLDSGPYMYFAPEKPTLTEKA